jgi:hypothetical protein
VLNNKHFTLLVSFAGLLLLIYFNFFNDNRLTPLIHGDTPSYLKHSQVSVLNSDFFFGKTLFYEGIDNRPFMVPLFYKLLGGNIQLIVIWQKLFQCFSVFFFTTCFFPLLVNKYVRLFFVFCIFFLFSWWNIRGWTNLVISESLSISFFLIWVGSLVLYLQKNNVGTYILLIVSTICFALTRDHWIYPIIIVFALLTLLKFRKHLFNYIGLMIVSILLFVYIGFTSNVGRRHVMPFLNNTLIRILPDKGYTDWYVKKGMPLNSYIINWAGRNAYTGPHVDSLWTSGVSSNFVQWHYKHGQSVYIQFLITHIKFAVSILWQNKNEMQAHNLTQYTGEGKSKISRLTNKVFPMFNFLSTLLISLFVAYLYLKSKNEFYLLPIILYLAFMFNAVGCTLIDPCDIERHNWFNSIIMQVIGFGAVSFACDHYFKKFKLKKVNYTKLKNGKEKEIHNFE